VEWNYEIHNKEMLAIIHALEEWRHFLEEAIHPVEIWTDHKNLEYFMMAKKLNHRQARWSLHLTRFDFLLHHRPRHAMGKLDALSRKADHGNGASDNEERCPPLTGVPCSACLERSRTDRHGTEDLVRYMQRKLEWRPRGTYC